MTTALSIRDIRQSFDTGETQTEILHGINLDAYRGEIIAILGTSGSGKSTLLNILGLLATPTGGTYTLDGTSAENLTARDRATTRLHRISFVFQSFHLIDYKNVTENIELPLIYQGVPATERRHRVASIVERLGLSHRATASTRTLSGGEKQRVAIARAVVTEPTLLLCDEPTGALDQKRSYEVMELLREVTGSQQTTIIVTHDRDIAARCDRSFYIEDGVMQEHGGTEERDPAPVQVGLPETKPERPKPSHNWVKASVGEAVRATFSRARRNLFTMLGVALGIAALVLTVGLSATIAGQLSDAFSVYQAKKVTLHYTGTSVPKTSSLLETLSGSSYAGLAELNGVEGTAAYRVINSGADVATSAAGATSLAPILGATEELFSVQEQKVVYGRSFDAGHVERAETVAVLGENLFKSLGVPWQEGLEVYVSGQPVPVIGVVAEHTQLSEHYGALYLPVSSTLLGQGSESFAVVLSVAPGAGQQVGAEAPLAFSPQQPGLYGATVPPEPETLKNAVNTQQQLLLIAMSLVTLVIGAVSTMNTFLIGVMERRQEIGLRLAIGTSPRSIIVQLGIETVLTSLIGTFIGILFSINAIALISLVNRWTPIINVQTIVLGVLAGLILGVLAGIYPAWKASRVDPIESLSG